MQHIFMQSSSKLGNSVIYLDSYSWIFFLSEQFKLNIKASINEYVALHKIKENFCLSFFAPKNAKIVRRHLQESKLSLLPC